MTTYFIKSGNTFMASAEGALDIRDHLPTGTYTVKFNELKGFYYLEVIENFTISTKIYGDTPKHADRVFRTFEDRPNSTGVMLSGDKGSGKTLLAKMLSIKGLEQDIPTIVVNQPHHGDEFNTFMQQIEQPTIVLFDEFEKVYNAQEQEKMLTLLDGVYPSKKMFILTCNDKYRIDSHMKNRPGRIYYRIDYSGLEQSFIREYCEDTLQAAEHIDTVVRIGGVFPSFNFDMLKAMVEEMNRYGETPQEVLHMLNAKPEHSDSNEYKAVIRYKGVEAAPRTWRGNPVGEEIGMYYKDEKGNTDYVDFTIGDLQPSNMSNGEYIFQNAEGVHLTLTRQPITQFNWSAV